MRLCMVILNYNDCQTTIGLLDKIKDYKIIDRILVVDNNSSDESMQRISEYASKYKAINVIRTDRNGGYAYGNNYGCEYAIKMWNPSYIAIANPDIYIAEKTIYKLLTLYEKREDAAIVSCIMNCTSNIDLPSAWKLPTFTDCLLENLLILRKIVGNRTRYKNLCDCIVKKVDVIAGSFFIIKSSVFKEIDGFDESTFLYYEENMLASRIAKRKLSNYIICDETYDHMHSVSINKSYKSIGKRMDISQDSRKIYCEKYLNCGKFAMAIEKMTYHIGKINYLILKSTIGKLI